MSAEIITYWNGEELSYVLNAISALINSTDFNSLLKIVSYLGVMIVFMMGVLGQMKQEDWPKYVAALAVFVFVMTGPKETVTITDKSITMPSTVVGNVPMPLAWIGSTTSGIGSWLTDSVETVFQVLPPLFSGHTPYPPELSFTGGGGPLFGHRIIQESGMMSINTPILSQDMMEFYRECVIPDINTGYLDVNQLNKSANIWAMLNDTNPARYVTIHNYNAGTGKWAWDTSAINCQQAYTRLTVYLNSEAAANLKQLGRRMNYKSTQAAAEALIVGQLQNGYGAMLGISANAVDIVQQKMMTNFIREASYKIPAMSGDPSSTQIGLAQAQAEAQYASSSLTMRKVAEGLLPKVRNVIEALIYALFPILIIYVIMAGHNALKPFAMYLKLAIWIQLWPMLYAILNFFITFGAAKQWQAQTLGDGLAMQYSALINAGAASDMAVAGMMVSSIPAIAWMLASGSVYAATQVANGMMAPANSAASSAGSQAALGNISMGNTNLRTANADKYDMTPSINTGTMSMRGGDGMQHNIMTGGRTSMNAGLQMDNLPVNASSNFEKAASLNQSASVAKQSAMTHQSSYETSIGSAMSKVMGKVTQGGYDTSFSNIQDQGLRTTLSEGASAVKKVSEDLSQGTGITSKQMAELVAGAEAKGLGLPSLSGKIAKKYGSEAASKFDQNLQNSNASDLKKVADFTNAIAENEQAMQGFNFSQSERTGIESNLQQARTSKQAMSASLQESKSYQEQAQEAIKTALMAGYDLGKTGAGRMAFLAAEKVRREGGGFNEQASAALKAFMDDNALKHAPVNLPSNAASPVLTGGNNAITRDYTGNQANVNANNATGLAGAAGANPNQFKQVVDDKATDLAFKQDATTVAAREFDAQQQGKDATTTQKLDADPNNPNNKGVSVGGRGQVKVDSSQVIDVSIAADTDLLTTTNNLKNGTAGNVVRSSIDAGKKIVNGRTSNNAPETQFDPKHVDVPLAPQSTTQSLPVAKSPATTANDAKPSTLKNDVVGGGSATLSGAALSNNAQTASATAPTNTDNKASPTIGVNEAKIDNKAAPALDITAGNTAKANALADHSSQGAMTASDSNNRPDVNQHQATGQTSVNTPTPQPTEATAAPQAAAKPVPVDKEPVTQGKDATTTQKLDADPNNPNNKGVSVGGRGQVKVDSSQVIDVSIAADTDLLTTTNNLKNGTAGNVVRSSIDAGKKIVNGRTSNNAPETQFDPKHVDVPLAPQSTAQSLPVAKSPATTANDAKPSTLKNDVVGGGSATLSGAALSNNAQTASATAPTNTDNKASPTIGVNEAKIDNKAAPALDITAGNTAKANALADHSSQGAMTASDSNNRPDVNQHQATGQTSVNTPTPQPTEATAAPQAAAKPVPVDKEPVTQGTEAKTTSTTPATDRVQPSTGMANASPDQSSQVMMSASDNTNRPDVSHNQSTNDRGAQADVRTVETQTQTNTVETQHHTRTVTQQTGESSRPKSAPKVGNDNPKDAKPSDRGDKPDVSK